MWGFGKNIFTPPHLEPMLTFARGKKMHLSLIDPDSQEPGEAGVLARRVEQYGSDGIMVGGSTVPDRETAYRTIEEIKKNCSLPVIIFPNNAQTLARNADYIFFMDVLNSPALEYKRQQQMAGAMLVKRWGITPIPTGYMVVSTSRKPTTVETKIPLEVVRGNDHEKAVNYAVYAECMGMQVVYMDAGSNPERPVPDEMVRAVREAVEIPLIVGGGIKTAELAQRKIAAGADVIVTGSLIEENVEQLSHIIQAIKSASSV
ncbi:MAG: phosphoglycerol geranylgeranyltransferase [Thermoplasmata archaeon]|nr:MAG: phosphoglycerol geranylgeranyltransferase [Thermoplasmata archaeon]